MAFLIKWTPVSAGPKRSDNRDYRNNNGKPNQFDASRYIPLRRNPKRHVTTVPEPKIISVHGRATTTRDKPRPAQPKDPPLTRSSLQIHIPPERALRTATSTQHHISSPTPTRTPQSPASAPFLNPAHTRAAIAQDARETPASITRPRTAGPSPLSPTNRKRRTHTAGSYNCIRLATLIPIRLSPPPPRFSEVQPSPLLRAATPVPSHTSPAFALKPSAPASTHSLKIPPSPSPPPASRTRARRRATARRVESSSPSEEETASAIPPRDPDFVPADESSPSQINTAPPSPAPPPADPHTHAPATPSSINTSQVRRAEDWLRSALTPAARSAMNNPSPPPGEDNAGETRAATLLTRPFPELTPHVNDNQLAVINMMQEVVEEVGTEKNPERLLAEMREAFAPVTLFNQDTVLNLGLYKNMYKVMVAYGVDFDATSDSSQFKSVRIAHALYPEETAPDERAIAVKAIADSRKNQGPRIGESGQDRNGDDKTNSGGGDPSRTIVDRYKHKSSTYQGTDTESWPEHISRFEQLADTQEINDAKKLLLLPLSLSEAAGRYFHNSVKGRVGTFEDAVKMISTQFNGPAKQRRCLSHFDALRLSKFLTDGASEQEALTKLHHEMERLFPQLPKDFQLEPFRIKQLKKAVTGRPWAALPIARLDSDVKTYNDFMNALTTSLLQHQDSEQATSGEAFYIHRRRQRERPTSATRAPRTSARRQPNIRSRPFFRSDKSKRCYNCRKTGHFARNCPLPPQKWSAKRIVAGMARDHNKSRGWRADDIRGINVVLLALCDEVTDACAFFDTHFGDVDSDGEAAINALQEDMRNLDANNDADANINDEEDNADGNNDGEEDNFLDARDFFAFDPDDDSGERPVLFVSDHSQKRSKPRLPILGHRDKIRDAVHEFVSPFDTNIVAAYLHSPPRTKDEYSDDDSGNKPNMDKTLSETERAQKEAQETPATFNADDFANLTLDDIDAHDRELETRIELSLIKLDIDPEEGRRRDLSGDPIDYATVRQAQRELHVDYETIENSRIARHVVHSDAETGLRIMSFLRDHDRENHEIISSLIIAESRARKQTTTAIGASTDNNALPLHGLPDDDEQVQYNQYSCSCPLVDDEETDDDEEESQVFVVDDVPVCNVNNVPKSTPARFEGACLDTGASRTIIGERQLKAYQSAIGHRLPLYPSKLKVRFGSGPTKSKGKTVLRIPLGNRTLLVVADVVSNDVPFLVGMDTFDRYKLTPDVVDNVLVSKENNGRHRCVRERGHLYYRWTVTRGDLEKELSFQEQGQFYTRAQLNKLHQHFYHPSPRRLYNLLQRANPNDCPPSTLKILEEIAESCRVCSAFKPRPLSFKVAMPADNIKFNNVLGLDLLWLQAGDKKRAVLHVVDVETGYNNAVFVRGQSTKDVWNAFLECWATVYLGHPSMMRVDQGTQFTSREWAQHAQDAGIVLQTTGIESHNSNSLVERYHAPLRRVYEKIRASDSSIQPPLALRLSVKTLNDTMGPDFLVPTLLVFGALPSLPTSTTTHPSRETRMRAMEVARREYESIVAQRRLSEALRARVPEAARHVYRPGDQVRVFREQDGRLHGPYRLAEVDRKQATLVIDGQRKQFNISQLSPVEKPPADHLVKVLYQALVAEYPPDENAHDPTVFVTETLQPKDPRRGSKMFKKAIREELQGLQVRGTWRLVRERDIPRGSNIVGYKFVLTIKDADTQTPRAKARLVAGGHRDKDKFVLVHDSKTVRPTSVRLILALSAIFGWRIWSTDVNQAYLQSTEEFARTVFMRPPPELGAPPGYLLQLLRPLYGLSDAGDLWYHTLAKFIAQELGLHQVVGDASLHYERGRATPRGLLGTYVDDTLMAGTNDFAEVTAKIGERFDSKEPVFDEFTFAGMELSSGLDGHRATQVRAASCLRPLPTEATFSDFKSRLMEAGWLVNSRPDLAYDVASLAQVTTASYARDKNPTIRSLNKMIKRVADDPDAGLRFDKLDKASLYLRVYSDGSFANNPGGSSQLGYFVGLCDQHDRCVPIAYRSYKCRRRVRSVLGSETMAFVDAFDVAFLIRAQLSAVLGRDVPIRALTDSRTLFDVMTRGTLTTERRLVIDLMAARDAYARGELSDIGHVSSQYNVADEFTKSTDCSRLAAMMRTGRLSHPVNEWILRDARAQQSANEKEAERLADERSGRRTRATGTGPTRFTGQSTRDSNEQVLWAGETSTIESHQASVKERAGLRPRRSPGISAFSARAHEHASCAAAEQARFNRAGEELNSVAARHRRSSLHEVLELLEEKEEGSGNDGDGSE